jgi:hypothetical protein
MDLGIFYSPYTGWQTSLHGLANLPTRLGKPPYTGWQSYFCMPPKFQDFLAAFFVYKSFLQASLQVLLQGFPHTVAVEKIFHEDYHSLFHVFTNS